MFNSFKNNRPRTQDIFIGNRDATGLVLSGPKQISDKETTYKYNGQLYPIIPEESNIKMKHLAWKNDVHIIDATWASDVKGIQDKYIQKQIDNPEMTQEEVETAIKKDIDNIKDKNGNKKSSLIKLDINPIFKISALKLYKWIEAEMLQGAYDAIVSNKVKRQSVIGYVLIGILIGGMGGYIGIQNFQHPTSIVSTITATQTEVCSSITLSNSISTQSCSLLTSSTSTSITATITAISSFQNGTVINAYSNGTRVCAKDC